MRHILVALIFLSTPAFAGKTMFFQSPSGNIQCAASTGDDADLRCDILEYSPSFEQFSPDCEFDWGGSFGLDANAEEGYLNCVSDAVAGGQPVTLDYGQEEQFGPFLCVSEKTGLTCTNPGGHGFSLSKAEQTLF
jgi:hypothetical protein